MRYFYRCADCLTVCATETDLKNGVCGACDGSMEYMGHVQRDRIVTTAERCPCDERCTNARGPVCECPCGGKNHGTGIMVEYTIDHGGVPRLAVNPAAQVKAEEYRGLVRMVQQAINARYGAVIEAKRQGEYLEAGDFRQYCEGTRLNRQLADTRAMRSHHGRNKNLVAMLNTLEPPIDAPPIPGMADREYKTRIEAAQVTASFAMKRPLDTGRMAIEDAPLFGGERQGRLF